MRVNPRLLTLLCYGAMLSLAIGINLLPVFLTTLGMLYGGAGGLTQEELGRLGAITFAGLVAGIVLTGPLADRCGAKPFALLGNILTGASLLAAAFAPGYKSLACALFFLGLGAGVLDMVLSPVVAALNPHRRVAAMNWLHSFYCVGAVVTILVGTVVLHAGYGWRFACLVFLPFPATFSVAFAFLSFPPLAVEGTHISARSLFRQRWFRLALVAIFLGGAAELGMAQWLPAYAENELGYPTWIGGAALLAFSVAMAIGRMVIGAAGKKWDPYVMMSWGCGLTTVLFLCGSFLPIHSLALAACIVAGFTGSGLWPTMLAVTADRHPEGGASMFGLLAMFGNADGIWMPWTVGWIADRWGLHWGLAMSSLAPALLLYLIFELRSKRTT